MKVAAQREVVIARSHLELLHARYITHSFSRHAPEMFAIGVIEQGAEAFSYQREKHIAHAGSIVVINPGEVHTDSAGVVMSCWTYRMCCILTSNFCSRLHGKLSNKHQKYSYFPTAVIQVVLQK